MTVRHIVVWTVKATDETEKAEALARMQTLLTGLVGRIPSILSLTVGLNGAYPDKNADVALVAEFADYEGLANYQQHPDHLEVAATIRTLVSSRASIDFDF